MRLRSAENKSELQPGHFAIKNADQSKLIEIKPGTKKAPRMGRLNQVLGTLDGAQIILCPRMVGVELYGGFKFGFRL